MTDAMSETLHQSDDWIRALFEQSPMGVLVYDRALILRTFNRRFVEMLRTTPQALHGLDLNRLRDQRVLPAFRQALLGEQATYQGPYSATTSDATVILSVTVTPLRDAAGEVLGATAVVEDISERTRAQDALAASEARFRALTERSPDAICVYRDGDIVFANPAMVRALGYEVEQDLLGRALLSLIHPSDHKLVLARRERMLAGEQNPPVELRVVRRDGSVGFIEIVSMQVDYDGAPASLSVARDTTERRIMQAELLQADRMASVGTLAAGVAHEINNPLAYLKGNLDALASRKLGDISARVDALAQEALKAGVASREDVDALTAALADAKEMVRVAREGADQMRAIVADLKTFSRSDDAPSSWVDVQRVLEAALHVAWTEVRARATVERSFEPMPSVYANESRLAQVFLNVLINAAHAIPKGGGGEIKVSTRTGSSGEAIVQVSDNGAGMSPEVRARIFDPFFTTKPAGVGTGLGLWICQGIVTALGGRIEVASEAGHGATFTVVLPQREVIASEPRIPIASSRRRGHVLVIDDQREILRVIERALRERHKVTCSNDSEVALAKVEAGEKFSLVLCDLSMPVLDGIRLYERAVAADPDLASRFIFLTGAATDQASRQFLAAHAHLIKPFELPDLVYAVEQRLALP